MTETQFTCLFLFLSQQLFPRGFLSCHYRSLPLMMRTMSGAADMLLTCWQGASHRGHIRFVPILLISSLNAPKHQPRCGCDRSLTSNPQMIYASWLGVNSNFTYKPPTQPLVVKCRIEIKQHEMHICRFICSKLKVVKCFVMF